MFYEPYGLRDSAARQMRKPCGRLRVRRRCNIVPDEQLSELTRGGDGEWNLQQTKHYVCSAALAVPSAVSDLSLEEPGWSESPGFFFFFFFTPKKKEST